VLGSSFALFSARDSCSCSAPRMRSRARTALSVHPRVQSRKPCRARHSALSLALWERILLARRPAGDKVVNRRCICGQQLLKTQRCLGAIATVS
jgi:hypothetical protein